MSGMVGILGGMGSYAGAALLQHALSYSKATRDEDFPKVLYYNLPVSGMDQTGVTNTKALFSQLRPAISHMAAFGCDHIVIGCNSAHALWPQLQGMVPCRIVNMIELAINYTMEHRPFGLLCSRSTKESALYDLPLRTVSDEKIIHTTEPEQQLIDQVIARAIAGDNGYAFLEDICHGLIARGAKSIVVGCTELELCMIPKEGVIFAGRLAVENAVDSACGQLSVHHG